MSMLSPELQDESSLVQEISETKLRKYENILRDLGEITEFLEDDDVNEIMVNSNKKLFIDTESRGLVYITEFSADRTMRIIKSLADNAEQTINETTQRVALELPIYKCMNGERFCGQIPPMTPSPSFTLRKKPKQVYSLESYIACNRATAKEIDAIFEATKPGSLEDNNPVLADIYGNLLDSGLICNLSREARLGQAPKNIVFCGGPGSGKTAALNALLKKVIELSPKERFIVIEKQMSEVQCRSENVQQFISNNRVSIQDCVETAMVSRPDRAILGEAKGAEAFDMCKIWNTGTPGGMATIHANNPLECFQRIGDLCLEAGLLTIPWNLILMTVDVIVWCSRNGSLKGFIKEVLFNKGSDHEETKFLEKIKFTKV